MATTGKAKKLPSKVAVSDRDFYIPPVSLGVAPPVESVGEDVINGIIVLIIFGFLLPLIGMMYLDILEAKHEVKAQTEKIEKLRREIEKERRDANPNRPQ